MIRELIYSDLDDAIKIATLRQRVGGIETVVDVETIRGYLLENLDGKVAFGYFENNELLSWIGIKLHTNKKRGKFWTISFLFSKLSHNWFSFNRVEIKPLFQKVFEYAENKEYYDFYYCIGKRIMHVYEKQWGKNNFLSTGKYDLVTLDVIPPNTEPNIELYWLLMNKELKNDSILIKKRSLKSHLRKNN